MNDRRSPRRIAIERNRLTGMKGNFRKTFFLIKHRATTVAANSVPDASK
jgi:hypothetical protein